MIKESKDKNKDVHRYTPVKQGTRNSEDRRRHNVTDEVVSRKKKAFSMHTNKEINIET